MFNVAHFITGDISSFSVSFHHGDPQKLPLPPPVVNLREKLGDGLDMLLVSLAFFYMYLLSLRFCFYTVWRFFIVHALLQHLSHTSNVLDVTSSRLLDPTYIFFPSINKRITWVLLQFSRGFMMAISSDSLQKQPPAVFCEKRCS